MRSLLITAGSPYLNPTEGLLRDVLGQLGSVEVVDLQRRHWASQGSRREHLSHRGRPRLVLVDTAATLYAVRSMLSLGQDDSGDGSFQGNSGSIADFLREARAAGSLTVASLLRLDPHAWDGDWELPLLALFDHFLGLDPIHAPSDAQVAQAALDETFKVRLDSTYFDFSKRRRHRLVPFPHFVSSRTDKPRVRPLNLQSRPRWAVPGIRYRERKIAEDVLRGSGTRVDVSSAYRIAALSYRLRLGMRSANALARWRYNLQIRRADVAFVSGSQLNLPVRKFFEVPAMGTLMVAQPFTGMADLGFIPYVHFVPAQAENLAETNEWVTRHSAIAGRIAQAGQDMVWRKHSDSARAEMLRAAIAAADGSDLPTIRWVSGHWEMD